MTSDEATRLNPEISDLPAWPATLTREQGKAVKQRSSEFESVLKARARAAEWRYARGGVFRQAGDWFVAASPSLTWERGALVQLMIKPMAIDPLFWEIVGLPENRKLPLSFRTTGAWVLRPATLDGQVGHDIGGLEPLADAVLSWVVDRSNEVLVEISVETMLAALPDDADLRGQTRALAICLRILANDLDGAMRLCRVREPDAHPLSREGGGFTTGHPDGSTSTFLDQARDWIVSRRRSALSLARR